MTNRSPQHASSGVHRLHRLLDRTTQPPTEVVEAIALLGRDHDLARVLELVAVLRRQLIVASLALGAGGLALAFDTAWATATIDSSAVVVLVFALIRPGSSGC
jgi:hypothetical protein